MWTVQDSKELYNLVEWGSGYFDVNDKGNVVVQPTRSPESGIDLKVLIDELQGRGISLPILVRFSDILEKRIEEICLSFENATREFGYRAPYRGVYPIKVNEQRHVVEAIVQSGARYHFGLEAGSKPELLAVLGMIEDPEALVVCNGYKDDEYIEIALLGRKLGINVILVVEKYNELEAILRASERLGVEPSIGMRIRLSSKGAGKWEASGGDRSKFGLGPVEALRAVQLLRDRDKLDCFKLLHYHLGSQICSVRRLRAALREAGRYYVELRRAGANLLYLDVGGGLAVDYDGSRTNFASSANYTVQEYANTVVYEIQGVCDEAEVEHPIIVSESGRALTAYHSILVTNVLGVTEIQTNHVDPGVVGEDAPQQVCDLLEIHQSVSRKNYQESYHDAQDLRDQLLDLFNLGYVSLHWRAVGESIYWATLGKIWRVALEVDYVPDEFEDLDRLLSDIYFCNMSVFQSLPDSWAIGHIFPILPIHRLHERPDRRAVLADITCDSDGRIERFVDLRDVKKTLPLHTLRNDDEYLLGIFLVGAYQEILGDLHNLFGDNNAVLISWDEETRTYRIDHVEDGDTVNDVLHYVQQSRERLVNRFRGRVERAVRAKEVSIEAAREMIHRYRMGFDGYTYMERGSTPR